MNDFFAALGLVFVLEGLLFAAFPGAAKRSLATILVTPEAGLRMVGIVSAAFGVVVVWLVRG